MLNLINQNNERSVAKLAQPGVPNYAGLTGNALLAAVVATGTVGFALFGYGECSFLPVVQTVAGGHR